MKLGYFPGCSLHSTAKPYDMSTQEIFKALGMELNEIPDWNCCGATPAHSEDHLLALALPARNLALAEKAGIKEIIAPCAACYSHLKKSAVEAQDKKLHQKLQKIIEMEYKNSSNVRNILEVLVTLVGLDKIKARVKKPLKGLKVASYYGCLLTRPHKVTQFDHPTNPQTMDDVMRALGADVVEWGAKADCCGASYAVSKTEVVYNLSGHILESAKEAGADVIATACPMCQSNLDTRQSNIEKIFEREFDLPILYVTELIGLSFGIPALRLGLGKRLVSANKVLANIS